MKISLIVPCHNEQDAAPSVLPASLSPPVPLVMRTGLLLFSEGPGAV